MTGIQFGFNPLFQQGFSNTSAVTTTQAPSQSQPAATPAPAEHVVNNPTSQAQPANSYTLGYLPAYFVAYAPVAAGFALASPGIGGVAGQSPTAGSASAEAPAGHVTQNPTSSVSYGGGSEAGALGGGGYGGFAGVGFAQPIILSPVLFQFGIPVYFQNPPVAPSPQPVPQNPVIDDGEPTVVDDVQPPVGGDTPPVVDGVDDTADDDLFQTLPIERLTREDFDQLRYRSAERSVETELVLELTTQDGDKVSLDFRQLELQSRTRLAGQLTEGGQIRFSERSSSSERFVSITVEGDLSDEEKAAIDSLLDTVIGVANKFFKGNVSAAMERLQNLDFNTEELADFSLKMSFSAKVNVDKVFLGEGGQLESLAIRDKEVSALLNFFADEQTKLVESAKEQFGDPSAAKLVRALLPKLVTAPFEQLHKHIEASEPVDQVPVEPEALDS